MTVEDQLVAHVGLGFLVRRCMGIFYAYDGMVGLQDPEWLKGKLNVLIGLFLW